MADLWNRAGHYMLRVVLVYYSELDVLSLAFSRCCGKSTTQTSSLSTRSVYNSTVSLTPCEAVSKPLKFRLMLRTRPSCILHSSTIDTTVVYSTVVCVKDTTVVPAYYGHDRRVYSTDPLDTTVVYTTVVYVKDTTVVPAYYGHDRRVQDGRVSYGHDRRKTATHTNQTTTTNQP